MYDENLFFFAQWGFMDNITQLSTFKALESNRRNRNADVIESLLPTSELRERAGLVRVQFEVAPELRASLDNLCSSFDISKREFLEAALVDSLDKAWEIFTDISKRASDAYALELQAVEEEDKC